MTISLIVRHPLWNTIGLPLIGLLYVRAKDVPKIPAKQNWQFQTKLALAVRKHCDSHSWQSQRENVYGSSLMVLMRKLQFCARWWPLA